MSFGGGGASDGGEVAVAVTIGVRRRGRYDLRGARCLILL